MSRASKVKEFTFGEKFVTFITAWNFDANNFAAYLITLPGPVLMQVLRVFHTLIDAMGDAYLAQTYRPEDMDVFVKAQQMKDSMQHFGF